MPMTANGLAKLLEELGELSQVAAKRLAYFHTRTHPDGAGDLNRRMEDEIADVVAACRFVTQQFDLDPVHITMREARKLALFNEWHADPDNGKDCFHAVPLQSSVNLDTEAAILMRVAAAVPMPHDNTLCMVAQRLRARNAGVMASNANWPEPAAAGASVKAQPTTYDTVTHGVKTCAGSCCDCGNGCAAPGGGGNDGR